MKRSTTNRPYRDYNSAIITSPCLHRMAPTDPGRYGLSPLQWRVVAVVGWVLAVTGWAILAMVV